MKKLATAIAMSTLMSSAMWAVPAFAEMGKEHVGSGEASRDAGGADVKFDPAAKASPPKIEAGEETRAAPITDEKKAVESFTALTRSADGTVTRSAPSDEMRDLVLQDINNAGGAMMGGAKKVEKSEDPAFTEGEEANRQVFGDDDRVQIKNTKASPFPVFGYIEAKTKTGVGGCSGTLIGPRTVLTAAHCLYSHEDKDWLTEVLFAPGLNSFDDIPFGAYAAESTTVVEGFVTNYQGYYGSVVPWDLGIITLAEPIGEKIGYLGYWNYEDLGDFAANIVGYPGDKPAGTMWRASCNVLAEMISETNFSYDCDTYPGSSGSSVYAYDNAAKQRVVVGVNVAESPENNTAVRLNATYVAWINSLWK